MEIQKLDPFEFEKFTAKLLEDKGYDCMVTSKSGDYGADVIAQSSKQKIAVQCKKYSKHNKIGVKDIYPVFAAKHFYECDKALIVTTSDGLTYPATVLARKLGIIIWNNNKLSKEVNDKHYIDFKSILIILFWVLVLIITIIGGW